MVYILVRSVRGLRGTNPLTRKEKCPTFCVSCHFPKGKMGKKAANLVLKQCQDGGREGRICQNGRKGRCQSATIEKNASSLAEKMMPNRQKGKENDAKKAENIVSDQH